MASAPFSRRLLGLNVVLTLAACVPTLHLLAKTWSGNSIWSYLAGDWLISFRGGIARRGLGGTVLDLMPGAQFRAVEIAVLLLGVAVPMLYGLLVWRAVLATRAPHPLLWWFLPGGVLMGMAQGYWQPLSEASVAFVARKEYLAYAVLLTFVLVVPRVTHSAWWLLLFGTAFAVVVLIHEGVGLIIVLGAALWTVRACGWRGLGAVLAPPVAVAFAIVQMPPSDVGALWDAVDAPTKTWLGGEMPMSLFWTGFTPSGAVAFVQDKVFDTGQWRSWLLVAVVCVLWFLLSTWLTDRRRVWRAAGLLAVFLPAVSLLAVFGTDWGRWIVLTTTTAAILVVADTSPDTVPVRGVIAPVVAIALVAVSIVTGIPESGPDAGGLLQDMLSQVSRPRR